MMDARLFVLGNNTLLLVLGILFFGLQRNLIQIGLAFSVAIALEWVLANISANVTANVSGKHRKIPKFSDRALSSSVAAASTLVLIRSHSLWFYAALTGIAILSKYFVTNHLGRHIFNPTNFAIVAALAFFPNYIQLQPDQFSSTYLLWIPILFFGTLAAFYGARWVCSFGYFLTVFGFGLPVGMLLGVKPLWILAPEFNTSTLIFVFLMITDPKSSPAGFRWQLLFGSTVALIHLYLRYIQIPYSPFIALFIVTGLSDRFRTKGVLGEKLS